MADVQFLVCHILQTGKHPVDDKQTAGAALSQQLLDTEANVKLLVQGLGAELASLEQFVETFSTSELGRLQPFASAHQRGAVAVLYQRLRTLLKSAAVLSTLVRTAQTLQGTHAEGVPPELLPPALELSPVGLGDAPAAHGPQNNVEGQLHNGAASSARLRKRPLRHGDPAFAATSGSLAPPGAPSNGQAPPVILEMATVAASQQAVDAAQVERQMSEVSAMLSIISEKLMEQQDDVQSVLSDAIQARAQVAQGNKHLQQANERPSSLRDFVVALLLIMTAVLWFLDWYSR